MLSGDGDEMRITPPPPAPTALDTPVRRRPTTPEHVRPRMEVDEATTPATPAPLVVAEFPASPSTPSSDRDSPPPLIPTPDDDLPFAEAIRDDASADADAEASNAPMDLEPLVFSTPPTEPASASPSTSPTPVVHDAAVDEQTRAQIMAMFAQRWERAPVTLEHTHTRAPSPMPMPPTLSRSASRTGTRCARSKTPPLPLHPIPYSKPWVSPAGSPCISRARGSVSWRGTGIGWRC
ncbi:hypothetical protein C8R46DRAFT_390060 [Mycena filopes]|nr:hypothetical protein C8R46DRAFT_390060 [Mycena filopes]